MTLTSEAQANYKRARLLRKKLREVCHLILESPW
jgi:ribosomal protein L22